MENNELTGKEAYEARKAQKTKEKSEAGGSSALKKAMPWVLGIAIIIVVGAGISWLVASKLPKTPDLSKEVPIQSRDHIPLNSEHPPYNSNPPTSGWHYAQTAPIGFYDVGETPDDEYIVHNLEHGDILIAYHPRISQEQKDALRGFVSAKVLVAAREANDTDIALAAWGQLDAFDLDDDGRIPEERIRDFITRHKNKAPESLNSPQLHDR